MCEVQTVGENSIIHMHNACTLDICSKFLQMLFSHIYQCLHAPGGTNSDLRLELLSRAVLSETYIIHKVFVSF